MNPRDGGHYSQNTTRCDSLLIFLPLSQKSKSEERGGHNMSRMKFHVSEDGVARRCQAKTPESCTVGGDHFDTREKA